MMNENNDIKQESKVKELGVFELRGLARELGISSPTTKKREELISLILEKLKSGFVLDSKERRKGRPFKKLSAIEDIVSYMTEEVQDREQPSTFESIVMFAQEVPNYATQSLDEKTLNIEAIVRKDKHCYKANNREKWVLFKEDEVNYNKLRQGDKVQVEAKSTTQKNHYLASKILKINDIDADNYKPQEYQDLNEVISREVIKVGDISIAIGKRNAIKLKEDIYENDNFELLAKYCEKNNIKFVVLGINTSFEDQIMFQNIQFENFTTRYGTDNITNFNELINAITYTENLIMNGKDTILFILDIMEIIRLIDRYFDFKEEQIIRTNNTKIILYKIMELGRTYQDGHSSTLLIGYNELDKDDSILKSEVLRISKLIN